MEIKRLDIDLKHLKTYYIPYNVITDKLTMMFFLNEVSTLAINLRFLLFDQCKS